MNYPSAISFQVAAKTNGRCFYCNRMADQIDHVTSKSKWKEWGLEPYLGDVNNIENLVPACWKCNRSKSNRTPDEFTQNPNIWARIDRANRRIGVGHPEHINKLSPFDHYEWLTFLQKYG